jgi:type IV pilus assembly protein PilV
MRKLLLERPPRSAGFSMIEVLITLFIIAIGLLGLAATQARLQIADVEAYQRGQALVLVNDIVDRINANRAAAACYAITPPGASSPYLGDPSGGGYLGAPGCAIGSATAEAIARANADLAEWDGLLQGSAEQRGGGAAGAMLGARGCVAFDPVTNAYTVVVAWQGLNDTFTPVVGCGNGLYGAETSRRAVWTTVRIASLM